MTLARIRVAFCSVWPPCSPPRGRRPPDRRRLRAAKRRRSRSPPTRSRSRCRSIPRSPSARCRTACATTCARMPSRRAAPSCGWSSRRDRCSKTTTSRAWRISSSTCCSRARGTFRGRASASSWRRSASASDRTRTRRRATTTRSTLLRVPTDVPGVLDRALLVLEDWAQARDVRPGRASSASAASCSRSGACTSAPASGRRTSCASVQLEGSRYADRSPIGKPEIIERAQREQLLRFYRDWYRPDLMAVIVVGDVDRDAVATMIKKRFSSLTSPAPKRPRPAFDVPERPGTRYAIVTDKETTATAVAISDLRPARNQGSVGGYRDIIARPAVRRHARRQARRAEPARERAVPQGRRPIATCSRCRGRRTRR